MIGGPPVELVDRSQDTVLPPTFGASLRAARLSRNISLDTVAAQTKINRTFFHDLERNDLSKWPPGQFYRESYLRAYARAVGLNPEEVIDGFRREFVDVAAPDVEDSPVRPRRLTPFTISIILAVALAVSYSLARWLSADQEVPPAPAVAVDQPATDRPAVVDPPAVAATSGIDPATVATAPAASSLEAPPAESVQPPSATAGELIITSTPPGARVLVNGIARGQTPLQLQNLAAGSYTIRFIYPGLPGVTHQATISPKRPSVQVSASFEASEPAGADSP